MAPLVERLARALDAEPPLMARDGGFIAPGYHAGLDELRTLRDDSRRLIARLQARLTDETGITAPSRSGTTTSSAIISRCPRATPTA